MIFEWDEKKRLSNLEKHNLDFKDAAAVYFSSNKITLKTERNNESRLQDMALIKVEQDILSLIYVLRGDKVRVISFRFASREERKIYETRKSLKLGTRTV